MQMDDRVLRLNIPMGQKVMCGTIIGLSREKGFCWAGDEVIANLLYTSENSVRNTISQLYKATYVKNIGSRSARKLVFVGDQKEVKNHLTLQSQNEKQGEVKSQNEIFKSQNEIYTYIIYKYKLKEGQNENLTLTEFYTLTFEFFWKHFPKRVKKQEALTLFKKIGLDDLDVLLGTLPAIKNYHNKNNHPENAFIPDCPHPTTFIRGKRWEDDVYLSKKIAKDGAEIFVDYEMERCVQKFVALSDGDEAVLSEEDNAVLRLLGMSVDDAVDEIQYYNVEKLRKRIATVWGKVTKAVA